MNTENRQEKAALAEARQSRVAQIQKALLDWHDTTKQLGYVPLFEQFAATAAERDVQHRLALEEARQIKAQGFGALRLAQAQGGSGVTLPELFFVVRDLARADPNIAHIFRNHFFAVEQHLAAPDTPFAARLLPQVAQGKTLGVAFNELTGEPAGAVGRTPGTQLEKDATQPGWRISGTKSIRPAIYTPIICWLPSRIRTLRRSNNSLFRPRPRVSAWTTTGMALARS